MGGFAMKCLTFTDIVNYLKQTQNMKKKEAIEQHLQTCSKCRKMIEEFEKIRKLKMMENGNKTDSCFDEIDLIEYLEARHNVKTHQKYYAHLSQCNYCLDRLIVLESMLNELKNEGLIPVQKSFGEKIAELIVTGKTKIKENLSGFRKWLPSPAPAYRWGGVAFLVLLISLTVFQLLQEDKAPMTTRESTFENEIQLRSPKNRSIVTNLSRLNFEWSAVQKVSAYNFVLIDINGMIIWEKKTNRSELRLPDDIQLQSSMTYFWQVKACIDFGITIQSEMSNFIYNHQ